MNTICKRVRYTFLKRYKYDVEKHAEWAILRTLAPCYIRRSITWHNLTIEARIDNGENILREAFVRKHFIVLKTKQSNHTYMIMHTIDNLLPI